MSLTVDGVWKVGVWATTVWANGVWFEGSPTPPAAEQYSGGWFDPPTGKRKTKAQLRTEREEWGILPKKAQALIKRIATEQVERFEEPPANTEALIAAFQRAELAYKEAYETLYRQEIERQIAMMEEEEAVLLLLH